MYISPVLQFKNNSFTFKAGENGGRLGRVSSPYKDPGEADEALKQGLPIFTNPYLLDHDQAPVSGDVIRAKYLNLFDIAYKDPRSRANSRTALDRDLPVIIKKLAAEGKPLTIAMFDMDNFKSVNEILGYTTGDEFISTIGNTIHDEVKPSGFAAYRYGGEEYMILFPGKTADEVQDIVTDVQNKINNNQKMDSFLAQYIQKGTEKIDELTEKERPIQYLRTLATSVIQTRVKLDVYNGVLSVDEGVDRIINAGDTLLVKSSKKVTPEEIAKSHALQAYAEGTKKRLMAIQRSKLKGNINMGEDLAAKVQSREETYKNTLSGIIQDMAQTVDPKEREFLLHYAKRLDGCKSLKEFEKVDNSRLIDYIAANHDKSAQIANFRNWVTQVQRVQNGKMAGFTITGGVKQFEPDTKRDVKEYYEEVGAVLKSGKYKNKGRVYLEDGSDLGECSAV